MTLTTTPLKRPDVLLIVTDSARLDRFGCYGYPRGTTPAINALAGAGTVFEQMIAPAPWTLPSHGSLFTGLYPREHGADYPGYRMRSGPLTLDQHLRAHGYRTVYLSNNPLVGPKTGIVDEGSEVLRRRDFDGAPRGRWRSSRTLARTLLGRADRGSAGATLAAQRILRETRDPCFIFLNYMECHWRYLAPRSFERRFVRRRFSLIDSVLYRRRIRRRYSWENGRLSDPEEAALLSDLYDAALACVDSRIGDLLEALDRTGRTESTVVIVTADHGEQIGDHELSGHGMWLYETLLHIPFMARVPGQAPARVRGLAQLTDVFAGLCRLLGIEVPEHLTRRRFAADPDWMTMTSGGTGRDHAFGEWHHSEGSDLHRRLARSHFTSPPDMQSVRDERYKLIMQPATGKEWLFDLLEDPSEEQDRSSDLPAQRARLAQVLQEWKETFQPVGSSRPYSPEEEEAVEGRLRELGYL